MNRGAYVQYFPDTIWVDERVKHLTLVERVLARSPDSLVEYTRDLKRLIQQARNRPGARTAGKRELLLTRNDGAFFRPCPGTHRYLCCGYQTLDAGENCTLECSYCVLQTYLSNPLIVVFVNTDDMTRELESAFRRHQDQRIRLGTGELADSLALEHLTDFSDFIVPLVEQFPHVTFEFKTKTDSVEKLLTRKASGNVVVSWSLNSEVAIASDEWGTAPLDRRLAAARRCVEHGYRVGFHFDPLIVHEEWETNYKGVVEQLFHAVPPARIIWISLGALRFPPSLKPIIQERFPQTRIIYEEFIVGEDGKLRYFKPIRVELYKKMVEWIREKAPYAFIYLCMESADVWKQVFGRAPKNNCELGRMLDEQC
jgi:spore photoproduct lyase